MKHINNSFKFDETQVNAIMEKVKPIIAKVAAPDAQGIMEFYIRKRANDLNRAEFGVWLDKFLKDAFNATV